MMSMGRRLQKMLGKGLLAAGVLAAGFIAGPGGSARAETGVSDSEILLGQSVYLSGVMAELGNDFRAGAELYFDAVNKRGGIFGRKIRVLSLDDAYDPKKAVENASELEKKGVFAFFQFAGTGTVREVAPIAASHRIPLLAAIATGPDLRANLNPYTFYIRPGNTEEYEAMIRHLITLSLDKVAVVNIDEPYGEEGLRAVTAIMAKEGKKPLAAVSIKKNGDGAEAAVKQLLAKAPQAVILITLPASTKAFVLAAQKAGLSSTLYTCNAGLPPGTIKEMNGAAHGVVVTQGFPNVNNNTVPIIREYQEAARKAGRTQFSSNHLEGYINAKVITEALQRAGKGLTRDGLVAALEGMGRFDLGGYAVQFSKTRHDGSHDVELSIVGRDGSFVY